MWNNPPGVIPPQRNDFVSIWTQHLAAVSSRTLKKETVMGNDAAGKLDAQTEADLRKTLGEIDLAAAQTRKLITETKYYPMVVGASLLAAGIGFAKLFM
jgi:hypothetical protein